MIAKIRIRTPEGQASGVAMKIRPFLIGRAQHKQTVSPNNDTIIWEIDTEPRHFKGICRNVAAYQAIIKTIFTSSAMKKLALSALKPWDREALQDMLENHTKIEIIKGAEAWEKQD